jgi:Uma2 family endonuclease
MAKKITSINQLDPNKTYTYADYLTWKFEEYVELIKGKVLRMAAPNRFHQNISLSLSRIIGNFLLKKDCKVYAAPFDVRLPHFSKKKNKDIITVIQPDICVICDKNKLDVQGCIGAPDLIIEILSPGNSKKEMRDKFQVYEEAGVREYWIIHPVEKMLQRFVLNEQGKYIGLQPLVEDDIATTEVLQGLEINLMDIFEE